VNSVTVSSIFTDTRLSIRRQTQIIPSNPVASSKSTISLVEFEREIEKLESSLLIVLFISPKERASFLYARPRNVMPSVAAAPNRKSGDAGSKPPTPGTAFDE
jgi:hypothetical protein